MDDVKVCRRCRKLFQGYRAENCPACEQELDEVFTQARDYLYEHPHENMLSLSKALGVREADILYFVRQGRLSFSSAEGSGVSCEQCGKPIASGRVCDGCKNSVYKAMGDMAARDSAKSAPVQKPVLTKQTGSNYIGDIAKR